MQHANRLNRSDDAEECAVLLDKCVGNPCEIGRQNYDEASNAFFTKHGVKWQQCIPKRGAGR